MKPYLKQYKVRFVLIIVAIILRQLLLVVAQQLNAGIFNQLEEKNIHQFFYVVIGMVIV